jgi:hypothetical protein
MAFFKAMLNRYRLGERVIDENGLDVAALLERHTEYIAKVGLRCQSCSRHDERARDALFPNHPHR